MGLTVSHWFFLAIPFAVLGTICAAPNFNLADGCLVLVSSVIGFVLIICSLRLPGLAIVAGAVAGWITGGIEKNVRLKPAGNSTEESSGGDSDIPAAAADTPQKIRGEELPQ